MGFGVSQILKISKHICTPTPTIKKLWSSFESVIFSFQIKEKTYQTQNQFLGRLIVLVIKYFVFVYLNTFLCSSSYYCIYNFQECPSSHTHFTGFCRQKERILIQILISEVAKLE